MNAPSEQSIEILFSPLVLRNITLPNRIIRSATYEGMGNADGVPDIALAELYADLAAGGTGTMITGFVHISPEGRAMQPGQCGIDTDEKQAAWHRIVQRVKQQHPETRLFMQLAHTGRQTRKIITRHRVYGVSRRTCSYFRQRTQVLDTPQIETIIEQFAAAAKRAKDAGFDGVQLHAAHGYLIHQFLSPWTNNRKDLWGNRNVFLERTVQAVQQACGRDYPILIKLSAAEDTVPGITIQDTIATVQHLESLGIDAVEISYGTMEYALNIIRGACPVDLVLKVNPMFKTIPAVVRRLWKYFRADTYRKRFISFSHHYNAASAATIKQACRLPVFTVGGIRNIEDIAKCLGDYHLDGISLCRPLLCEPDFPRKLKHDPAIRSACTNCNVCTIYCDDNRALRCYRKRSVN